MRLRKAPQNQNLKVWMQEWEKVYMEYAELSLPKVDGNRSVKDFIYTVDSVSLSWLEYWKSEFQTREWEKRKLPTFFEIVEIYQNIRRTELAQKGKTPQGSFAATLKGAVILLDWSGVDLTPQSTPYAEEAVELQDSNMTPDQIYTINSKSWQKIRKRVREEECTKSTPNHKASI